VEELNRIALNFQETMRPLLGSFQTVLNRVNQTDKDLSRGMQEIEEIANLLISRQVDHVSMNDDPVSQRILDFLVASELKKDRLLDALENSRNANSEVEFDYGLKNANGETSLDVCLENIQTYVQFQLSPVLEAKKTKEEQEQKQEQERRSQAALKELNLKLVDIPAGSFIMGDQENYSARPAHQVDLLTFRIGKYPITQKQYLLVMGTNPSNHRGDENRPVEKVSWDDAVNFCEELSKRIGRKVKLPSEAQWEYACRAGSTGKYWFDDNVSTLDDYAWYSDNSRYYPNKVGDKLANPWGLHDMYGNVWEWCEDEWHENYNGAPVDGSAWLTGGNQGRRALRGGSVNDNNCNSANRKMGNEDWRTYDIGFRVVI
jgi:formylglycine-generating enzyme required for sulfatase activity